MIFKNDLHYISTLNMPYYKRRTGRKYRIAKRSYRRGYSRRVSRTKSYFKGTDTNSVM